MPRHFATAVTLERALAVTLALMLVLPARAPAQVLAQVNPVRLSLSAPAGVALRRDIQVSNLGTEPVDVRMRMSDWRVNDQGELSLAPAGSTPGSLMGMVEFSPDTFSLSPGATLWVHVKLTPPAQGPATHWGILLGEFRAKQPDLVPGGRGRVEVGTTFLLSRLPLDAAQATLAEPVLSNSGRDSLEVEWPVRNSGERHFSLEANFALMDSTGARVATGASSAGILLPGSRRDLGWFCPVPAPGRYRLTISLDDGSGRPLVSEVSIRWPLAAATGAPGAAPATR